MLRLQTWMVIVVAELRDRSTTVLKQRRESGLATLEYVVIAAIVFVAAVGLATLIANRISQHSAKINPPT